MDRCIVAFIPLSYNKWFHWNWLKLCWAEFCVHDFVLLGNIHLIRHSRSNKYLRYIYILLVATCSTVKSTVRHHLIYISILACDSSSFHLITNLVESYSLITLEMTNPFYVNCGLHIRRWQFLFNWTPTTNIVDK